MNDLVQCTAVREDLLRWLALRNGYMTVYKDDKAVSMLVSLEKNAFMDYLYHIALEEDGTVSWKNSLTFCGVHVMKDDALYMTDDVLRLLMDSTAPLVTQTGPSMVEEIRGRIDRRVEDIIANDRNNIPAREVTDWRALRYLQYYKDCGAAEEATQCFVYGIEPDVRFHSGYILDGLPEAAFLAYLQSPEDFVRSEAERHIKIDQERFLLQYLENDALLSEYHALVQDVDSPIHRMKSITDAVKASGAKTVTVTVQKDEQELTFNAAANSLIGPRDFYSVYDIAAQDRCIFEQMFGRHTNYKVEDITRITYGKNTIYEAPTVRMEEPVETMGPTMQMGGM